MDILTRLKGLFIKPQQSKSQEEEVAERVEAVKQQLRDSITTAFQTIRTTSSNASDSRRENSPIKRDSNGHWILNPTSTFPLTLMTDDKSIASEVRARLDKIYLDVADKLYLVSLFAKHNLQIREIVDYKNKYGTIYKNRIAELISTSSEWAEAGTMDRNDLLNIFRENALDSIYEMAFCDLVTLFEFDHSNVSIDDDLIKEYGFDNVQTYLNHAHNIEKIYIYKQDHPGRSKLEKLVNLNLAVRGQSIPIQEVLLTLTMKELNEMARHPDKQFKRKIQAVDYLLTLPDLNRIVPEFVSLREAFKLLPLPDKFKHIDIQLISETWSYHTAEVDILVDTFSNATRHLDPLEDSEYISHYEVHCYEYRRMCPCAKDLMKERFSKDSAPSLPVHVGCRCNVNPVYKPYK